MTPRVLRVYHGGRDRGHRARERALAAAGVDMTLVVPANWHDGGAEARLSAETFPMIELEVRRPGDVNRHRYANVDRLARVIRESRPDILDLHEEPFSVAARQWLAAAPPALPVVCYTAQNVDKRFPPPFAQWETAAYARLRALYPCSRQAAAVARGKGFCRVIDVLPLGIDSELFRPGEQRLEPHKPVVLGLVGRLVPEKGVVDAVDVFARVRERGPARLEIVGSGPEERAARDRARVLGVSDDLQITAWLPADSIAEAYRRMHVILVPSSRTHTWVEQFGRVIVEARAAGTVVVGYSSGSIPEVGGDTTVLVPEHDVDGLACAVIDLLADPKRYDELRRRGITASADMTWTRVAQQQKELYERVIAGDVPELDLPREARRRRAAAEGEFGPPARLAGGSRQPFALPVLRNDTGWSRALAAALDASAGVLSRLRHS